MAGPWMAYHSAQAAVVGLGISLELQNASMSMELALLQHAGWLNCLPSCLFSLQSEVINLLPKHSDSRSHAWRARCALTRHSSRTPFASHRAIVFEQGDTNEQTLHLLLASVGGLQTCN